jgi:acetyl esterase/lipase
MTSKTQKMFNLWARYVQKPTLAMVAHQPTLGKILDLTAAAEKKLPGTKTDFINLPDFRVRHLAPPNADKNLLIYFHGGGFTIGSSFSHQWLAARLADQIGAETWLPDYRLAPAHPYPAAPDDCLAAYRHALKTTDPDRIVLAGDSAGGTLVLNTITRIAKTDLPQPAAIALLSPLADLTGNNPSRETYRHSDMLLPDAWVKRSGRHYLAGADPRDPDISPQHADLSMAPPCALHVAHGEMLFDDAERLAELLPTVDYRKWHDVPHVWQLAAGRSPEADASLRLMAEFLNKHLP